MPDSDIAKATSRVISIIWDLDFVDIFRVLFMILLLSPGSFFDFGFKRC
jgi:hypothetical protein